MNVATFNTSRTPTLVTFGQEFMNHGGLRLLAMAVEMDDEDPIDDLSWYIDTCYRYLDEEKVLAGYSDSEDLYPLIEACLELCEQYGRGVWVAAALKDYLHAVKGIRDAEEICDRMISDAEGQFEALLEVQRQEAEVERYLSNKEMIPQLESELERVKVKVAKYEQKLAQAA